MIEGQNKPPSCRLAALSSIGHRETLLLGTQLLHLSARLKLFHAFFDYLKESV